MLEMRYQEGQTFADIANSLNMSDSTIHRRVNNALKRMIAILGGDSPYAHHQRRRPSNSEAIALAQDQ